jgi:hypothetical protein
MYLWAAAQKAAYEKYQRIDEASDRHRLELGEVNGLDFRAAEIDPETAKGPEGERFVAIIRDRSNPPASAWAWFHTWEAARDFIRLAHRAEQRGVI